MKIYIFALPGHLNLFPPQTNLKTNKTSISTHTSFEQILYAASSCFINKQTNFFLVNKRLFEEAESFIIMHFYVCHVQLQYTVLTEGSVQPITQKQYLILYS